MTYRAVPAHQCAPSAWRISGASLERSWSTRLREAVLHLLAHRCSPEQIAHSLPQRYADDPTLRSSYEAIYTDLSVLPRGACKRELTRYLRRRHRVRGLVKSDSRLAPCKILWASRSATPRSPTARVPGHWEEDLLVLVGHANASAVGSLVERTTRFTVLVTLKAKDPTTMRRAFAREMRRLQAQLRRFLTYHQGQEMREHRLFTKQTKMRFYSAHPQCPWEGETNENANGLLRQFFPVATHFNRISRYEIKRVPAMLTDRPRKILNWHSPAHAFTTCCARILNAQKPPTSSVCQ